jgi:hypothetical protein
VLLFILALIALVVRSDLRHSAGSVGQVIAPPTRTVQFTVTTLPTQYAGTMISHMQPAGEVYIQTSGNFVPMGTLRSVTEEPDRVTIDNGAGAIVVASVPGEHVLRLVVTAQAEVAQKTVSINGIPYYIDQHASFHEGAAQFAGVITDLQVR